MNIKNIIFTLIFIVLFCGCKSNDKSMYLSRQYGEFIRHDFQMLGVNILICTPEPEIMIIENDGIVIRGNQLPDSEPGFGHMLFIGLVKVTEEVMQKKWNNSVSEKSPHSQWLAKRHESLSINESPWIVSLRRDILLPDGTWIYVSAMIHAYDIDGKPYIVPEDVKVAKQMIESIEPM
jgi:hypothetical protein